MKRGFTLIEILVVIAIIGLLASIILGFVNDARNKGNDKKVIANLVSLRNAIELYYNNNGNSYGSAGSGPAGPTVAAGCNDGMFASLSVRPHVLASNYPSFSQGNGLCYASFQFFGVWVGLSTPNRYWCIDSSGSSKQTIGYPADISTIGPC